MATRRIRVAVVDDDEPVARALRRLLRTADMDVATFASGDEFLHWLTQERPDCVVLDLHMPGMNGLDVQRWLIRSAQQIPIVVVTGYDEAEAHSACLAAGAASCLRKPVDEKTLLDAIYRAIAPAPH